MKISVNLIKHDNEFIANCPELDINCFGSNKNEALKRIKNVIYFYVESARDLGLDVENLHEIMIDGESRIPLGNESLHTMPDTIN
jgi:predicted RNase H-like HicB family nuclease